MVSVRAILAVALAAGALAAPARAAEYDIPWFSANPAARQHWLRACTADHRLARDLRCANAQSAESLDYSRRLARRGGVTGGGLPPAFQTPLLRDAERMACARPEAERGLLAGNCRRT